MSTNPAPKRFRFGPFEIETDTGELTKSGRLLRLAPQPSRVLSILVSRSGQTVTREELHSLVWNDGTVVEFDQGLNYCIRQIRLVLNEDNKNPQFIETIPKRGYRFIAVVERVMPVDPVPVTPAAPETPAEPVEPTTPQMPRRSSWWWPPIATAAAIFTLLAANHWPEPKSHFPLHPEAKRSFQEAENLADDNGNRKRAIELYHRVTELEPDFAPAWAGLANIEIMQIFGGAPNSIEVRRTAEAHARRAVALDDSSSLAHAVLAHTLWHQWKWNDAETEFERALTLDPNSAIAHHLYALCLACRGKKAEAIRHARQAVELAPTSGLVNYTLAMVYFETGELPLAVQQARKTLEVSRHFPSAYGLLIDALTLSGDLPAAESVLEERSRVLRPEGSDIPKAYWLAHARRYEEARAIVTAYEKSRAPGQPFNSGVAGVWLALGDRDRAFHALDRSFQARVGGLSFLKSSPTLRPLQGDPRFHALLTKMGNP